MVSLDPFLSMMINSAYLTLFLALFMEFSIIKLLDNWLNDELIMLKVKLCKKDNTSSSSSIEM